jgi:hypothetical protein
MWSVNLDTSISGKYQTLAGHSCWPSEHLSVPATNLGASATTLGVLARSLGARRITVEQSGKNNFFFGNAAGTPGNHSHYLSFNAI